MLRKKAQNYLRGVFKYKKGLGRILVKRKKPFLLGLGIICLLVVVGLVLGRGYFLQGLGKPAVFPSNGIKNMQLKNDTRVITGGGTVTVNAVASKKDTHFGDTTKVGIYNENHTREVSSGKKAMLPSTNFVSTTEANVDINPTSLPAGNYWLRFTTKLPDGQWELAEGALLVYDTATGSAPGTSSSSSIVIIQASFTPGSPAIIAGGSTVIDGVIAPEGHFDSTTLAEIYDAPANSDPASGGTLQTGIVTGILLKSATEAMVTIDPSTLVVDKSYWLRLTTKLASGVTEKADLSIIVNSPPPPSSETKMTAGQLLSLSVAAMGSAKSYSFYGDTSLNYITNGVNGSRDFKVAQEGTYTNPQLNYFKATVSDPKTTETGSFEVYYNGQVIYLRASGIEKDNSWPEAKWINMGAGKFSTYSAMNNPLASMKLLTGRTKSLTLGEKQQVNGKNYLTLIATIDPAMLRVLFGTVLQVAEQTIQSNTSTPGNLNLENGSTRPGDVSGLITTLDGTLTYLIDTETMLVQKVEFSAAEMANLQGDTESTTINIKAKGTLYLKDFNQSVTIPDVSRAVPKP